MWIRTRIDFVWLEGENNQQNIFLFWSSEFSRLRATGFYCSLAFLSQILVIKTLDTDPEPDQDPHYNQYGSTTLPSFMPKHAPEVSWACLRGGPKNVDCLPRIVRLGAMATILFFRYSYSWPRYSYEETKYFYLNYIKISNVNCTLRQRVQSNYDIIAAETRQVGTTLWTSLAFNWLSSWLRVTSYLRGGRGIRTWISTICRQRCLMLRMSSSEISVPMEISAASFTFSSI